MVIVSTLKTAMLVLGVGGRGAWKGAASVVRRCDLVNKHIACPRQSKDLSFVPGTSVSLLRLVSPALYYLRQKSDFSWTRFVESTCHLFWLSCLSLFFLDLLLLSLTFLFVFRLFTFSFSLICLLLVHITMMGGTAQKSDRKQHQIP